MTPKEVLEKARIAAGIQGPCKNCAWYHPEIPINGCMLGTCGKHNDWAQFFPWDPQSKIEQHGTQKR